MTCEDDVHLGIVVVSSLEQASSSLILRSPSLSTLHLIHDESFSTSHFYQGCFFCYKSWSLSVEAVLLAILCGL
jgi:hypothetical protein